MPEFPYYILWCNKHPCLHEPTSCKTPFVFGLSHLVCITKIIIDQIFSLARDWSRHVGEHSPAKTGECPRIFPNFQNCARWEKDLKDNKHNSLHFG